MKPFIPKYGPEYVHFGRRRRRRFNPNDYEYADKNCMNIILPFSPSYLDKPKIRDVTNLPYPDNLYQLKQLKSTKSPNAKK